MVHSTEHKMDELKKLLRRLDGLEAGKGVIKAAEAGDADQRGYVGALRGTPDADAADPPPGKNETAAGSPAALWAAALLAIVSSVGAYLAMSHNGPVKFELNNAPATYAGDRQRASSGVHQELIRSADRLLETGNIEGARALLQRAAELGSGEAALKLGRTYDPSQTRLSSLAEGQANQALAREWYERSLALGTQDAAAYIRPQKAR